jgi:hypothetical protein
MVRVGRATITHQGHLEPLLVGIAVRQSLTPTARAQTALVGRAGVTAPTWRAALVGSPPGPGHLSVRAAG